MATRKTIGLQGEHEAARYLRQRGYTIIAQRERILHGDIDIVALDSAQLSLSKCVLKRPPNVVILLKQSTHEKSSVFVH